jgi:hypothetical protein
MDIIARTATVTAIDCLNQGRFSAEAPTNLLGRGFANLKE